MSRTSCELGALDAARQSGASSAALGLFAVFASTGCVHVSHHPVAAERAHAAAAWLDHDDAEGVGRLADVDPSTRLLRALVAEDRLDAEGLLREAVALAREAPESGQAEAALRLAAAMPELRRAHREALVGALDLALDGSSPSLRRFTYARLRRRLGGSADELARLAQRAGWVEAGVEIVGPLGPLDPIALARFDGGPASLSGSGAVRRRAPAGDDIAIASDGTPGLYALVLAGSALPSTLLLWTPGPARVLVAGKEVARLEHRGRLAAPVPAGAEVVVAIRTPSSGRAALARREASDALEAPLATAPLLPGRAGAHAEARLSLLADGPGPVAAREALARALGTRAAEHAGAASLRLLARILAARGAPRPRVEELLRRGLDADPAHPGLLVDLARHLLDDDPKAAQALLDRSRAVLPPSRSAELGVEVADRLGDPTRSLEAIQALAARPDASRTALEIAARQARALGRCGLATRLEDRADEDRPRRRARRLEARGLAVEAAQAWALLAVRSPGDAAQALSARAELALRGGDLDDAARLARAALAEDPRAVAALRVLLRCARARGDEAESASTADRLEARGAAELGELLASEGALRGGEQPRILAGPDGGRHELHGSPWPSVILLDRADDRILRDGRAFSYRSLSRRILSEEGARAYEVLPVDSVGELVLELSTVAPSGLTVPAERAAESEGWAYVSVDPGDTVVARWLALDAASGPLDGSVRSFAFGADVPVRRAEWIVRLPLGRPFRTRSFHGAPEPEIAKAGSEVVLTFRMDDVPALPPEPWSPPAERFLPFAVVWSGVDDEVLRLARDRTERPEPAAPSVVAATAAALTRGSRDRGEQATRIADWILRTIRRGPERAPDQILDARQGRRDILLAALARSVGIDARLAVAQPGSAPPELSSFPNPDSFRTVGVRLELPEGPLWGRLDAEAPWMGPLPRVFAGGAWRAVDERALHPIPLDEADAPAVSATLDVEVDALGRAVGRLVLTLHGDEAAPVRARWSDTPPSDRMTLAVTWLASLLPGATLRSTRVAGAESCWSPLVIELGVVHPTLFDREGDQLTSSGLLAASVAERAIGAPTFDDILALGERNSPLALAPTRTRTEWTLRFPEGSRTSEHPPDRTWASRFGTLAQRFEADGRARRIVREHRSYGLDLPARSLHALKAWVGPASAAWSAPLTLRLPRTGTSTSSGGESNDALRPP